MQVKHRKWGRNGPFLEGAAKGLRKHLKVV